MVKEEKRARTGPVSPGPSKLRGVLFYYLPETGGFKARFTHYTTLKEAQADAVEVECYGRPFSRISLKNSPRLAELLLKTAHAIPDEIAELEALMALVFSIGRDSGVKAEREKHAHDIEVLIEDDPEGGGR